MAGSSWSHTLAFGAAVLALHTVAACNAVLGIEPAELGETKEALTCAWPIQDPTKDCKACEACATRCNIGDCLADQSCRKGLWNFKKCAGDSCSDSGQHCLGCADGNPMADETAKCLASCDCNLAGAVTICEGYCACMNDRCPTNEPGGSQDACLTACISGQSGLQLPVHKPDPAVAALWQNPLDPSTAYCFWQHCERGSEINDPAHCDHAIGSSQKSVCPAPADRSPSTTVCPYPKAYGNAPCNKDADCCSERCDLSLKVCIGP
jgi:hypothetical protein